MAQRIAVIGLGSMGYGMATSCLKAGLTVHGFDLDADRAAQFQAAGGAPGALAEVAEDLDAVVLVVLNAQQVEGVLFGDDRLVPRMRSGSVVVACATVPPAFARQMERRCQSENIHYLDAPISGGSVKAATGALGVMASGTIEAFDAADAVLGATAKTIFRLGDAAGAGSAMKAVNQLLAGVHIAAMAEALTFGMTQGVDPETFLKVISECAGTSWMLENRAPHIVAGDYTPHSQINIWPKDLRIVLEAAESADFHAPITSVALARYQEAVAMGLGREDDAAVAKVYAREAGLTLPGDA